MIRTEAGSCWIAVSIQLPPLWGGLRENCTPEWGWPCPNSQRTSLWWWTSPPAWLSPNRGHCSGGLCPGWACSAEQMWQCLTNADWIKRQKWFRATKHKTIIVTNPLAWAFAHLLVKHLVLWCFDKIHKTTETRIGDIPRTNETKRLTSDTPVVYTASSPSAPVISLWWIMWIENLDQILQMIW